MYKNFERKDKRLTIYIINIKKYNMMLNELFLTFYIYLKFSKKKQKNQKLKNIIKTHKYHMIIKKYEDHMNYEQLLEK